MLFESAYISGNCNQTPTAAHWGSSGLVCYAACHAIAIYNPKINKVTNTLAGHSKRVNSVRWIGPHELVSGSSDHTAIVWTLNDTKYTPTVLKNNDIINIVDGLYKSDDKNGAVVAAVGMDATVKIWFRRSPGEVFKLRQTIDFGYSICVGLRLVRTPETGAIIAACAPDNSNIELHVENPEGHFDLGAVLKGHEDWVRGLDFTNDEDDLILASSAQDMYIRLWRISTKASPATLKTIKISGALHNISLDSILTGHEGWIYSVAWSPKSLQLLSSSLDKSMVIWELDPASGLWMDKIRVGEVGGNILGFYGGGFAPDGNTIMAHSYHGAFHIWTCTNGHWSPSVTPGGHFSEVTDLAWEPHGEFLVSVSTDQTSRIHAPWAKMATWHEIARPQVHGYDLSAIAVISRYTFASSAEEKIVRTFQAPMNFIENFQRICGIVEDVVKGQGPEGAAIPSLGLSNKAVFAQQLDAKGGDSEQFTPCVLSEPPTEETLIQNTLWPEIQKLYGHGYEVYTLAASPNGALLASACKATSAEHAAVLLWDTSTWGLIQKLKSHTLTVVQMAFSPDSQSLLTVSRDRRWSLFTKLDGKFELVATTDKKTSVHTRIIWCCCWSPDSRFFCTGSRDGKVCVWTRLQGAAIEGAGGLGGYGQAYGFLDLKSESVTAVCFAPVLIGGEYVVAVGLECGLVKVYFWNCQIGWNLVLDLDQSFGHHLAVRRLAFRPVGRSGRENGVLQLASCGNDCFVKIHNLTIKS